MLSPTAVDFTPPAMAVGRIAPQALASTITPPAVETSMEPTGESADFPPILAVTSRSTSAIAVETPTIFSAPLLSTPAIGMRKLLSADFTEILPRVPSRRRIDTPVAGASIAASTVCPWVCPSNTEAAPEIPQPVASAPPLTSMNTTPQWTASSVSPRSPNVIRVGAAATTIAFAASASTFVAVFRLSVPPMTARVVSLKVNTSTAKPAPEETFETVALSIGTEACIITLPAVTLTCCPPPAGTDGSWLICTPSSTIASQVLFTQKSCRAPASAVATTASRLGPAFGSR